MNELRRAAIVGTGMYAPENVIRNQYFDDLYKKDITTFLQTQRNISERRWMSPDQSTSDLIVPAALQALKEARIKAKDLDLIIVATDTPDFLSPSTASVVCHKLGCSGNIATFDVNSACAGFVTALEIGQKFIAADKNFKNVLVVGAYAMSKWLNKEDYKTTTVFGDGAGAAVLQPTTKGQGFITSTFFTEALYHDHMGIYAGGSANPLSEKVLANNEHLLAFPKRIPPETNGIHWPQLTRTLLERMGKMPNDVALYLITQFNVQSIYETMDRLEVPRSKAHYIMDKYGYTGSASIAMALADAVSAKKLQEGDLVLMLGSGGGMSMTAIALEWSYTT